MGNSSSKNKDAPRPTSSGGGGLSKFKKTIGGNKNSGGHVLGTTPTPTAPPAPTPSSPPRTTGGKTLGGGGPPADDARASAARAAEVTPPTERGRERICADHVQERANKAAGKGGKLSSQLAAQKKQTRSQTLDGISKQNQRARDADEAAEARNWQ